MLKRLFIAAILWLMPSLALAQAVQQSGTVTPGHVASWVTSGTVRDGGAATNGFVTNLGVFENGGLPICVTASTTARASFNPSSSPYTQLCWYANMGGNGGLTLNSYNGAANANLVFNINGTNYTYPPSGGGSGNVVGPNSSTVGDFAIFNNTSGTLLADQSPGTLNGLVSIITASGTVTLTATQKTVVIDKNTPAVTSVVLPAASNWPNCPASQNACPIYRIKDGAGNAATYPITVSTADSTTIDGQSSLVESVNYEEVDFLLIGTTWSAL